MRRRAVLIGGLAAGLGGCGPPLKGLAKGEVGTVAAVLDGHTLRLADGLTVILTGIKAPRRDEPHAAEARAALEALALGRPAQLAYGGLRRLPSETGPAGRETALAHGFAKTAGGRWLWLQEALVEDGRARVYAYKDNTARNEVLLAAEAEARAAEKGLWTERAYAVRAADRPAAIDEGLQLVEGVVQSVGESRGRTYLNFGTDRQTDFTVLIPAEDAEVWRSAGMSPAAYGGRSLRVRGYVTDRGGPLIVARHPGQIEDLSG